MTRTVSTQCFLQLRCRISFFISILHDDWSVKRQAPLASFVALNRARTGYHYGASWNFKWSFSAASIDGFTHQIINRSRSGNDRSRSQHRAFTHDRALVNSTVAANDHVVFDDYGYGSSRFQHAADLRRGRKMHALADLCARSDQCVTID